MNIKLSAASLALFVALVGCQSDSVSPDQPIEQPTKPDENTDSVNRFKKTRISWADTDYQEVEYDSIHRPIRITKQNQYVQGTDQVYRIVYELIYTGQQLVRVKALNGSVKTYVNYHYANNQVSYTQEFSATGRLIATQRYDYYPNNRLRRIVQTHGEGTPALVEKSQTFTYDTKGNLAQWVDAIKENSTGTYNVQRVLRYPTYDAHKNITNLGKVYPLLPGVIFQVNNPTIVGYYMEGPDGSEKLDYQANLVYTYNAQGYPLQHTETRPTFRLTATYSYVTY